MELNDKMTQLEDEIKILKNEVQAVLLDLRESYLSRENPFSTETPAVSGQPIIISQQSAPSQQPSMAQPPIQSQQPDMQPSAVRQDADELMPVENPESEPEPGDHGRGASEVGALATESEPADEAGPVSERKPAHKQRFIATEETAHEEVKRAWRAETGPTDGIDLAKTGDGSDGRIDLATIDGLAQWLVETVKRFGSERTAATLEIAEMMGHVPTQLKNILTRFISPTPGECPGDVTTRDYLASLIELDRLLGRENKSEVALLYILCQENDHR